MFLESPGTHAPLYNLVSVLPVAFSSSLLCGLGDGGGLLALCLDSGLFPWLIPTLPPPSWCPINLMEDTGAQSPWEVDMKFSKSLTYLCPVGLDDSQDT